jgi:predicted nucleic-acid-binding protein
MIALDTDVWVRYVTNDEPDQAKRALAVLAGAEEIFVAKTALLELEWVLRAAYELSAAAIIRALRQILGLPNVQVEMPDQLEKAIDYYEKGFDFTDALHLASSPEGVFLYTFDNAFFKRSLKTPVKLCDEAAGDVVCFNLASSTHTHNRQSGQKHPPLSGVRTVMDHSHPPLILMKCLLLQQWFRIDSDPELETQINDRSSFKTFLWLSLDQSSSDHFTFS